MKLKLKDNNKVCIDFGDLIHKAVATGLCVLIFGFQVEEELVDEILEVCQLIEYIYINKNNLRITNIYICIACGLYRS